MSLLPDITTRLDETVLLAMAEIQQPRSPFQLEKFVINQHSTPEMQYSQCVTEIQALYYTIKTVTLDMKIQEIKTKRRLETGDEIDALEAQKIELGLEQTRLVGIGAFRELETLLDIFESFPKKFTRQEIDAAQPEYWSARLHKQAILQELGGSQAGASHLEALTQIGAFEVPSETRELA
jgi:hypothetical protein